MMTKIQAPEFTKALADYLAAIEPALKRTTLGIQLFANASDDAVAAAQYSTLRHYDGEPASRHPRRHLAMQCETLAKRSDTRSAAVEAQAAADEIYGRLRTETGPLLRVDLAGFKLLAIANLKPPRPVGGEENGRARVVFNFDVYYLPTGG